MAKNDQIGLLTSPNNSIKENRTLTKRVNDFHNVQIQCPEDFNIVNEARKIKLKNNVYKYEFNLIAN